MTHDLIQEARDLLDRLSIEWGACPATLDYRRAARIRGIIGKARRRLARRMAAAE